MRCFYNTVIFFSQKYSQRTTHTSPVLWVQPLIDILPQFLQWFTTMMYTTSYYIVPRYSGTALQFEVKVIGQCVQVETLSAVSVLIRRVPIMEWRDVGIGGSPSVRIIRYIIHGLSFGTGNLGYETPHQFALLLLLYTGLILGLCPAIERRRYIVPTSLIGWVQA